MKVRIEKIQNRIHQETPINYKHGLAGIGATIEYLVQEGYIEADTDDIPENIDDRLFSLNDLFQIVHIHGNNQPEPFTLYTDVGNDICFPDVLEVTFVKKESILSKDLLSEEIEYPCQDLDYPNNPFRPDFKKLTFH